MIFKTCFYTFISFPYNFWDTFFDTPYISFIKQVNLSQKFDPQYQPHSDMALWRILRSDLLTLSALTKTPNVSQSSIKNVNQYFWRYLGRCLHHFPRKKLEVIIGGQKRPRRPKVEKCGLFWCIWSMIRPLVCLWQ